MEKKETTSERRPRHLTTELTAGDKTALVALLEQYGLPYFGETYRDELIAKLS